MARRSLLTLRTGSFPGVLLVFALVAVGCSGTDAGGDSSDAADQVARDDTETTVEAEPQVSEPGVRTEAAPTTVPPAPTSVPPTTPPPTTGPTMTPIDVSSDVTNVEQVPGLRRTLGASGVVAFGSTRYVESPTSPPLGFAKVGDSLWVLFRSGSGPSLESGVTLQRIDLTSGGDAVEVSQYAAGYLDPPRLRAAGDTVAAFFIGYNPAGGDGLTGAELFDARTGEMTARIGLQTANGDLGNFAVGAGSLWQADRSSVRRYDPATGAVIATIPIGPRARQPALHVTDDAVLLIDDRKISRIDPATDQLVATIEPPEGIGFFRAAGSPESGALWGSPVAVTDTVLFVKQSTTTNLLRIDLTTDTVDAVFDLGLTAPSPNTLVIDGDTLWFAGGGGLASISLSRFTADEGA